MSVAHQPQSDLENLVRREVPASVEITDVRFEGSEVIVYTKDIAYFRSNPTVIKRIAVNLQVRVSIRPDPSSKSSTRAAENTIRELVPNEAQITNITFHESIGEVVIEAKRPGLVIGSDGANVMELAEQTGWNVDVLRTPPIESTTIANVRGFLRKERDERREILERIGSRIHRDIEKDEEYVRVTTLGCCREVGRAAFILSTPTTRILIDCGDKPGAEDEYPYLEVQEALAGGASSLDAVVVTHAHLDHSALVPLLFKYGYDGPVFCTEPTRDLMGLLTLDYLNVTNKTGGTPPYTSSEIEEVMKHTITVDYGTKTQIAPDIRLTMENAGHILGSAVSSFEIDDGEHTVVFSGDIHNEDTQLFNGAVNEFSNVDSLILESTYGAREDTQATQTTAKEDLKQIINNTYQNGGKTLIPVFAVGRSQEIMLVLEEAMRNGEIPRMPIHLDGMIHEATAIHSAYPEYLRSGIRTRIFKNNTNPFLFDSINHIDGHEKERRSIRDSGPSIILTTSGMITGGPIMSWLQHLGSDPSSSMVFVGYQADGTLGNLIQDGLREIELNDEKQVSLEVSVETVDGFSGHADREGLLEFVETMPDSPDRVLCVHGDERAVKQISSAVYHDIGIRSFAPKNLETFRFD